MIAAEVCRCAKRELSYTKRANRLIVDSTFSCGIGFGGIRGMKGGYQFVFRAVKYAKVI